MPFSKLVFAQARQAAEPVLFELPWGTMRGLSWGNPAGKPLLALHGWLDNAHSFVPIADAFLASDLAADYQLIALDWAGHGLSDHRPAGNYYPFIDYVYDIWHICQQQQWSQVTILAHSMGAYVANMLAGIEPKLVRMLLAVEAFGLLASTVEDTHNDLREGFASRWQQQHKHRPHYRSIETAVTARVQAGDFERDLAALLVERGLEKLAEDDYRFRADGQLRVKSPVRLTAEQIGNVLEQIECPFRVILGHRGHARLKQSIEHWGSCVPHLRVEEVKGGHHVHMEQPAAIIVALSQMIRTHNG